MVGPLFRRRISNHRSVTRVHHIERHSVSYFTRQSMNPSACASTSGGFWHSPTELSAIVVQETCFNWTMKDHVRHHQLSTDRRAQPKQYVIQSNAPQPKPRRLPWAAPYLSSTVRRSESYNWVPQIGSTREQQNSAKVCFENKQLGRNRLVSFFLCTKLVLAQHLAFRIQASAFAPYHPCN